jgi:hypothetical protein
VSEPVRAAADAEVIVPIRGPVVAVGRDGRECVLHHRSDGLDGLIGPASS